MLDEERTNGHAAPRITDAGLAQIKRRLAEIADSGEQRVVALRDAIGEFVDGELAQRDTEIAMLKKRVADLERQTAVDQKVAEVAAQLDARQFARDEAKRGKTGRQGERGARGQQGLPGPRGPAGKPAPDRPTITALKLDVERYRIVTYLSNGQPGPTLDLHPAFERFLYEVGAGGL